MPLTLTVASGRVTPATVTVLAVTRAFSNGEVTWSFSAAEIRKGAGGGVELGIVVGDGDVAGGWVSGMGLAVEEIAAAVASGAEEVAAWSPAQATNSNKDTSTAAAKKGQNLIHHRPNT